MVPLDDLGPPSKTEDAERERHEKAWYDEEMRKSFS